MTSPLHKLIGVPYPCIRHPTGYVTCPTPKNKLMRAAVKLYNYICVLTNTGRYSEFRVTAPVGAPAGPSPGTLSIEYTTWE